MKSAVRLFYLTVFALWTSHVSCSQDACAISPKNIVDDACVSYATLDHLNSQLKPVLDDLTQTTDFFSHYRLNLFSKTCPFWDDNGGFCGNIGCAVETLENEEDIPEVWRARELGKLEGPLAKHPGKTEQKRHPERPLEGQLGDNVGESCVVEYDDECDERDYCVPEDESATSKGDYVSLLRNPERFTGYGGEGAKQVWDAIYRENCFQLSSFPRSANLGTSSPTGLAELDFKHVLNAAARHQQLITHPEDPSGGLEADDQCLEKRVFHRIISGMHASISAHLCWDYMNQTTGEWHPNTACYESRLHKHPDRISNLYFNYALVTQAVAKLGPLINDYTFCNDDPMEDSATRAKVLKVTNKAASVPNLFDQSLMFVNGEGPSLKEDFRNRFRNVSRLMDCVGCDKCRLWGKVQTAGYGTALKVLFEFDDKSKDVPMLKRTELVSLFNTHARLGESLGSIAKFKKLIEDVIPPSETPLANVVEEESEQEDKGEFAHGTVHYDEDLEDILEFQRLKRSRPNSDSVSEVFAHEMATVRLAVKIIVKGWMRTPKTFYHIFTSELKRMYQSWIGLPVQPRTWKFRLPGMGHDEL